MNTKNSIGLDHKYENYWEILRYNHDMIRFSELKAGLVISILGVLFSFLFQSLEKVGGYLSESWIILAIALVFLALMLVAMIHSFKCFVPRFEVKNPTSVIFFGDIVSEFENYEAYHKFIQNVMVDENAFTLQLAEQIHTNAKIATRKFASVKQAIKFLLLGLGCLIFLVCIIILKLML